MKTISIKKQKTEREKSQINVKSILYELNLMQDKNTQ